MDAAATPPVQSSIYLPVDRTGDSVAPGETGLLAEWIFAQKDGDIVPDASKHGFDARVCGHARLVSGPGDSQALEFGGIDAESAPGESPRAAGAPNAFWSGGRQDYGLSIGKRLDREFKALSVEAWVRKSPGWWMPVVYRDLWNSPWGFGLYAEWSSGRMAFGHYDDSGNSSEVFSKATVQDGQWHHVVGTMSAACDKGFVYRIYIDGQLDNESTGTWNVQQAPPEGGILKIAYPNASGGDQPYKGALGKVAIFDVALTPAQIKARFEAGQK